ncbi:MAG TPA: DUF2240 family protein [Candidatus Deferrimicrobium sp.]|nr:DUF2240 family protein [Candidatus Deferrimicrobium sp.]
MRTNINLEDVLNKIIQETKKTKKEIQQRIDKKKEDLGGLITDEGAACIVAKELGVEIFEPITYKRKRVQIKDITVGMNSISVIGRVQTIFQLRDFTRKNGQKGLVQKFILIDQTGQIPVVLWNDQTNVFSEKKIDMNDIVELKNTFAKDGFNNQLELSLGRSGLIEVNPKDINSSEFENLSTTAPMTKINQLQVPMWNVNLIGKIQWKSDITTFSKQDGEGRVASLNIFDETGTLRVALWDSHAAFAETVNINDIVKIIDGYTRQGRDNPIELHVGERSQIFKEAGTILDLPDANESSRPTNEIKIEELTPQSKNVKIIGVITEKDEPREVKFNDGTTHRVCDVLISDETGSVSLSIWDDEIEKIEKEKTYCIENGYISVFRSKMKLNTGKFGIIKKIDTIIKKVNRKNNLSEQELEVSRKFLSDITENETVEIFGTIISIPEQKPLYDSCPTCFKKVNPIGDTWNCERCGSVSAPVPRMLWSFILDDGTENIRVTVIGKVAEELLGMTTSDVVKMIEEVLIEHYPITSKSKELVGKPIIVKGNVRLNGFSSKLQLMANSTLFPNSREELTRILTRVEGTI